MDLMTDVRTLEELEEDTSGLLRDVQDRRRPVIIAREGKPDVVIIPASIMKRRIKALEAACDLAEV